jgi:hypothetical protein
VPKKERSKVLVFDIEAAGVQGLKADRGVMTHFGYKWLGEKKRTVLAIHDFPGSLKRNKLDDTGLLRAASKILSEAEAMIAHFGEYFDKPYVDARFVQAGLHPIPDMKLTDTCLISKRRFCLSSNRLANLARFLKVDTQKMEKGRGWPDWWMGALYGDVASLEKMRVYCGFDVECLEEVYLKMRAFVPMRFLPINQQIGEGRWCCSHCGGYRRQSRGIYWTDKRAYNRYQCVGCGAWSRGTTAVLLSPKT